jgi:hypothetical protein
MARISGSADAKDKSKWQGWDWTDESTFGRFDNDSTSSTYNTWVWNDRGMNSTIYKLMSWARSRWCTLQGISDGLNDQYAANDTAAQPTYFSEEFFSGLSLTAQDASTLYGGLIPLVALYKIDYPQG